MVLILQLRSSDTSSANNFVGFLEETLLNFGDKKVGLVRLDSGFQKDVMDYLELKTSNTSSFQNLLTPFNTW